ncbi:MAG: response regulator [Rhodospirillaceae bacterium]|nr:response regulator [Rhodospirillaceae bacterium]
MGALAPRPLRILVAEDDRFSRELVREQLASLGRACDLAIDGQAAWACAARSTYDLIICDYRMPGFDGPALARRIRDHEASRGPSAADCRRAHIAVISANADIDHAFACLSAGVDDFIAKPVALDVIEALVDRVAGSAKPAGEAAPAAPIDAAEPVIFDPATLVRLYGGGPRAAAAMTLWLSGAERDVSQLRSAWGRGDAIAMGEIAHRLKGSAALAGAHRVSEVAGRAERAAMGSTETQGAALAELVAAFAATRSELRAVAERLSSGG